MGNDFCRQCGSSQGCNCLTASGINRILGEELRNFGFIRDTEVAVAGGDLCDLLTCLRNGWNNRLQIWVRDLEKTIEVAILLGSPLRFESYNTFSFVDLIACDAMLGNIRRKLVGVGEMRPTNEEFYTLITFRKGA